MKPLIALAAVLAALALAPIAHASRLRSFQSPSHNIGCVILAAWARCDIRAATFSPPPKPRSCTLDWGQALSVGRSGRGRFVCAGDTVAGQGRVLRYGRSIRVGSLTCTSRRSGMRCRSARGHGFVLSRSAYRLF